MDYQKLLEKYNALLEQVGRLTKENNLLKSRLGLIESEPIPKTASYPALHLLESAAEH